MHHRIETRLGGLALLHRLADLAQQTALAANRHEGFWNAFERTQFYHANFPLAPLAAEWRRYATGSYSETLFARCLAVASRSGQVTKGCIIKLA